MAAGTATQTKANLARGVACALVSAVCFAVSGTVSKHLMDAYAFGPLWVAAARMLGSSVLFFAASFLVERGHAVAAARNPKTLLALATYGLCGVLFSQVGYLQAIDYTKRKYVKKAAGSPAGMVTYTNFKTLIIGLTPEDQAMIVKEASK